ncbi:MAG: PilZ domain-containing protein [Clostridiales bacterium]|nr:PilZ domain-containing protein [Clostridiales bacterium]MCD4714722.1 PilZ domain-containing protein [Clostridiales bacterium]
MELKNILLPAHSIEISVEEKDENGNSNIKLLKTVVETGYEDGKFRAVAPILHGNVYNFHPGDLIDVIFLLKDENKGIFSISCKVTERSIEENLSIISLDVLSEPQKIQRRQAFRVNVFNTYTFKYRGTERALVSKDISSTGMLALTNAYMKPSDTFELLFDANVSGSDQENNPDKIFRIKCRVLESTAEPEIRRYSNRIRFEGMSPTESKYLLQFLYAKQTEIIQSMPEYENYLDKLFSDQSSDRRKNMDRIQRRVHMIGYLNLFVVFFAFVFLLFAQPAPIYGLDRFFDYYRPKVWNIGYLRAAMGSASLAVLMGLAGLMMNATRLKRKNDTLNSGVIVSLILGLVIIGVMLYFVVMNDLVIF